jgi:hypothetical protein
MYLGQHAVQGDIELRKNFSRRKLLRLDISSMPLPPEASADKMICFGDFMSMEWDKIFEKQVHVT